MCVFTHFFKTEVIIKKEVLKIIKARLCSLVYICTAVLTTSTDVPDCFVLYYFFNFCNNRHNALNPSKLAGGLSCVKKLLQEFGVFVLSEADLFFFFGVVPAIV